MAKKVHEGGKIGRSSATPTKLFSVDFYNLKFMSFKFGNDIFITFEMPRSSFLLNDILEIINYRFLTTETNLNILEKPISLLFRPSVIRDPCLISPLLHFQNCLMQVPSGCLFPA